MQTLLNRSVFDYIRHGKTDAESTEPAAKHRPIVYPKPDGKLSFDEFVQMVSNTVRVLSFLSPRFRTFVSTIFFQDIVKQMTLEDLF